jgi:hypothetical protein
VIGPAASTLDHRAGESGEPEADELVVGRGDLA